MPNFYYSARDILDKAIGTDAYFQIKSILTGLQSADVAPVRHGKWIEMRADYEGGDGSLMSTYCSECGRDMGIGKANYCPNCGAHMDGEKEEEP